MIRNATLALVAATMLLTTQSASATVNLNGRISQIVNGLRTNAYFSLRDFSFTINAATPTRIFTGVEGIRLLNSADFNVLNDWVDQQPAPNNVFNGGPYKFTHSVLGGFFDAEEKPPVFNGAPYTFTHEVLDSYFDNPTPPVQQVMLIEPPVQPAINIAPVPEPASWAMMIGGFALAGAALRNRRVALSVA